MIEWNGHERRDHSPGRRSEDRGVCPEHYIIQDGTKDHRQLVCGKIAGIKQEIERMVPWKVLMLIVALSVTVVGSGFGFFGVAINRLADRHEAAMSEISREMRTLATGQAVLLVKVVAIEAKTDQIDADHRK